MKLNMNGNSSTLSEILKLNANNIYESICDNIPILSLGSTSNKILTKLKWSLDNVTYIDNTLEIQEEQIIGVNFYGNKVFLTNGIYELLDDLSLGDKLNENIPSELKKSNNKSLISINDKYYGIRDGINVSIYSFDEQSNELVLIETIEIQNINAIFGSGYQHNLFSSSYIYVFNTGDTLIGYNINGQNVYLNQSRNITTDKILSGYTSYAQDGSPISGTMTNNGELNITPSTQEQTIPEGYTSGGTVGAVDNTIDNNIQATNIKKDIVILGVTGTYEQKPNIFTQETEPQTKNGIWVKTNKTFANKVAVQRALSETGEYLKMTNIPYDFNDGSPAVVGTDIYLLGASLSGCRQYNYKYNTLTDTYTQMTDIPYEFYNGSAVAIGTDIYLLGGGISKTTNYKYDTLTDTYTKMADIPYEFYNGSAVAIGTDIYLWGDNVQYNYKYNTLTNTYTKMSNMPFSIYYNKIVAVGTNIYALGVGGGYIGNYKYDTLTDTFTKMTDIPYDFRYTPAVVIGTDIYLLGSASRQTNNYKYDTLTDTYEKMTDIPYDIYGGSAVLVGTNIYLLSSMEDEYSTNNYKYTLTLNTDIQNNSLVLEQGGMLYKTILFDSAFTNGIEYKFTSVWLKNEDGTIDNATPIYYGNGTEWIQFKGATN